MTRNLAWLLLALAACAKHEPPAPAPAPITADDLAAAQDLIRGDEADVDAAERKLAPVIGPPSTFTNDRAVWAIAGKRGCDWLEVVHFLPARAGMEPITAAEVQSAAAGMPWYAECLEWAAHEPTGLGDANRHANAAAFRDLTAASNPARVAAAAKLFQDTLDAIDRPDDHRDELGPEAWLAERLGAPSAPAGTDDIGWAVEDGERCVALGWVDGDVRRLDVRSGDDGWVQCARLAPSAGSAQTRSDAQVPATR